MGDSGDFWRDVKAALIFGLCALLAACDTESIDTEPADFERAKVDCAPHSGLASVTTVRVMFKGNRVDAHCGNGTRISRPQGGSNG